MRQLGLETSVGLSRRRDCVPLSCVCVCVWFCNESSPRCLFSRRYEFNPTGDSHDCIGRLSDIPSSILSLLLACVLLLIFFHLFCQNQVTGRCTSPLSCNCHFRTAALDYLSETCPHVCLLLCYSNSRICRMTRSWRSAIETFAPSCSRTTRRRRRYSAAACGTRPSPSEFPHHAYMGQILCTGTCV